MVQLNKHPSLIQCYAVMHNIELCGCSVELTAAVQEAGELMDAIESLVDSRNNLLDAVKAAYRNHYVNKENISCKELSILRTALIEELGEMAYIMWLGKVRDEIDKD